MISQAKIDKLCRKARQVLEKSGDIGKALLPLDKLLDGAGLLETPIDILTTRIELQSDAAHYEEAMASAEEALAARGDEADRIALLAALREIPAAPDDHRHLYRVWMQCAAIGFLAEALEVAQGFRTLPPNARKALQTAFLALRKEAPDTPLADLGIVHLAISLKQEQAAYPALARLSAFPPPVGAHAAEVLVRMPMPSGVELMWTRAAAFLLTGNRPGADAAIAGILKTDPAALVGFLQREQSETLLSAEEKEAAALLALERAPESIRTRAFLFELYRDSLRLDEALAELRTMAETDATPAALESFLHRAEDLVERFPEHTGPLLTRAWLLGRLNRAEELARSLRQLLPEAPAQVQKLLIEWSHAAGDAARTDDFLMLRAETAAALGRHAEATVELRRLLRSAEDPAAVIEPLITIAERYPGHTPYLLVLGRARYRAGDQVGAVLSFESLLERSADHADRVHTLLGSWNFEGEASPQAGVLNVRSLLIQDRIDDALSALERLVPLSRDHLDAGIEHALHWRERILLSASRVVRFASLMFRTGRTDGAIEFLADALTRDPGSSAELAAVFDHDHLVGRRELPILVFRCRVLMAADRREDAAAVAMHMGDAGHPKQEYRWLGRIRSGEGVDVPVLPRLLETGLRIGRPTAEILSLGRSIFENCAAVEVRAAYSLLLERHRNSGLGPAGLALLGEMAACLDLTEDAAAHFIEILPEDPAAARAGIDALLEKDPARDQARIALIRDLTARREFGPAMAYLRMTREPDAEAWDVLDALIAIVPPVLDAWDLKSTWLADHHRWDDLVGHLGRLTELEGADLAAIDRTLVSTGHSAKPGPAALWLRVRIARRTHLVREEIELFHQLADLGPGQFPEIFEHLEGLKRANPRLAELLQDELRLSARARDLNRVLAAGDAVLKHPDLDARVAETASILGDLTEEPLFRDSPPFLHLAFETACRASSSDLAHRVFLPLTRAEEDAPVTQDRICARWRETFGDSVDIVELQARARIRAHRATGSIPHIRRVVELGVAANMEEPVPAIRRGLELAEAAAASAPEDPNVHLLASDLAAEANDPERALLHALAPLEGGNLQPVLRQLERLNNDFPEDTRFAHALAVRVFEPIDRREGVAACLQTMLDRNAMTAPQVMEIAERLCAHRPAPAHFLGIRARAAVLLATGPAAAATRAVDCLRELLETDPERAAEALAGVDQVIAMRPESLPAYVLREEALRVLGRAEDACTCIEENVLPRARRSRDRFMAHYRLADALEELGRFDDALAHFRVCAEIDEENEEVPLRIRRDFALHRRSQAPALANGSDLERGVVALWRGAPEDALAAVGPPDHDDRPPSLGALAVRGSALLTLDRHAQLREELLPHLLRIPPGGTLTATEREFLFCLGVSALQTGDEAVGLQCLERIARRYPAHRAVRALLDRHYARRNAAAGRPLDITFTLEKAVRS